MSIESKNGGYNGPDISSYYTGETVEQDGIKYSVLDNIGAMDLFKDSENYLLGKKTEPTKIRKAIAGEVIDTYVKNESGKYVKEGSGAMAVEGDYIFQNLNNKYDTYIPKNFDMSEYEPMSDGGSLMSKFHRYLGKLTGKPQFELFIRKSKPSKILPGIIDKPTLLVIEHWGDYKQFLDKGATLKCEEKCVTGINKGGFEAWSIVDAEEDIIKSDTKSKFDEIV